jgi:TPR repeat protein
MSRATIRTLFAASVLFMFAMGAMPAWADLGSAAAAYKKGEFASAFQQFKELAELGQPEAQFDLAIMYARGEGITISNTYAHAWASLASTNGESRATALRERLESELTPTSLRDSVMRSIYLPARLNGQPIATPVSVFYNFKMDVSIDQYGNLEQRVKATLKEAEAGDPAAQMLYGMMVAGLPQLKQTYDKALPWFLKAAQAGARYAQYQIGTGLLTGHGCQCDASKGEIWLEKAAQADEPDAQVSLAEYLLKGNPDQESIGGALVWLERAAKQGNSPAKLRLSAILAASPVKSLRDPTRALELADSLEHELKHDPSLWEIRAAANASRTDFKAANKAQAQAIIEARKLDWDLTQLNQRQAAYASAQAWNGDLLAF